MSVDTKTGYAQPTHVGDNGPVDLLIVGTFSGGGIHQYITEQASRLPDELSVSVYDMVSPSSGSGIIWFIVSVLHSVWAALKYPLCRRPDIVHIHTSHRYSFYRASFYVIFSACIWRCPVILHIHGSSFDEFAETDDQAVQWLQSVVFSAVDRVVVLSEYWRDVISPYVDTGKIQVLPNAVDPTEYDPEYDGDPPHLVFVSNLIKRKGVRELVSALETLEERDVNFRATIAGKGSLSGIVEELASTYENIEYLGYVSESRKRQLLDSGTVFVLPTYAEGLPIAMLEGMAGGNAIVSTTVGSIPEVIDSESGILVDPGDPDGLADALETIIESPTRTQAMGKRNRKLIENEYSWERTTDQLNRIYQSEVLKGPITEPIARE